MKIKSLRLTPSVFLVIIVCLASISLKAGEQKLKVEDVLAKHLESIGSTEARNAVKNRIVNGSIVMTRLVGGGGSVSGKGQLLSEGKKFRLAYSFAQLDYPGEQVVFNGDKSEVGQIAPGKRSALENFFYTCDLIPKEGLLGGVLSTAWPLFDVTGRQAKLSYSGLVKMEGEQLHEIKYQAKKAASDLKITIYFDPETFRHVRTQYRLTVASAGLGDVADEDTIYTLTEKFAQFQQTDGLTLPLQTQLELTVRAPKGSIQDRWNFTIANITHNQTVDPGAFTILK